jgi:CRISPR-associated endonuclease Csn1
MGIRIGIDVGERSVGLAAVDYDDDGWPIEVLAAVSHIHDGGLDPDTAKSPRSRLATAGVARRTRRLIRNRRRRLKMLDAALVAHGIPVPDEELAQTHEAWHARAVLSEGFVADDTERGELLSLALRHMARHRGWRNPWFSYRRLLEEPSPSKALQEIFAEAEIRFGNPLIGQPVTLGQLVSRVADTQAPIRPIKGALAGATKQVMSTQIKQEDTLAEARLILRTQEVSDTSTEAICAALMFAAAPTIPKDRVGRCDLIRDLPRASTSALEFQEYRVRDGVANLRIGSAGRALTAEEHDSVVDFLLSWSDAEQPRWRDVAEVLGIGPRDLRQPSIDQGGGSKAPVDRTTINFEAKANKKSQLGSWWRAATPEARAELIDFITDLSGAADDPENDELAQFLSQATDESRELMEKIKIESGRASYSREALGRLNEVMKTHRCNAHGARVKAFDLPDDWTPTPASFHDDIEHPTVSRINALVHRFLITATKRWGVPEAIVVEHVRDSFMGPTALAEFKSDIRRNTNQRDKVKADLASQGVERPSNTDVRRFEAIQRQQSACLYCGTAINISNCELDHIVPRAGRGGNRRDNLVATCRSCNAGKGKLPFAVFAENSSNPDITVEAAIQRVRSWQKVGPGDSAKKLKVLQRDVSHRLTLREDDEDFGDRSIESTAYAARQMRERAQSFLIEHGGSRENVHVYAGAITAEARKAGGFDALIRLRAAKTKTRFDRRHHAIDAAVITSLRPSIAQILQTRNNLFRDHQTTRKYEGWREYRGATAGDIANFESWKQRAGVLAELLRDRIAINRVPVVRPLRLSPRVGSVHADTIEKLETKFINDTFSSEEIRRIIHTPLFSALTDESQGESLPVNEQRSEFLGWDPDRPVDLFPSNAAYLPVRGGAVSIGGSVRSARIYAWETKKGFAYGMVRMYAGEFGRIGLLAPGVDLFTAELPRTSQAMRTAPPALVERIYDGTARQIGWIAINDEIELDPQHWIKGSSLINEFMAAVPETTWYASGFKDEIRMSITPMVLASEGLDDAVPIPIRKVLTDNRIPLSVNVVLSSPNTTIIRRTILGTPRWHSNGLPTSWKPQEAAAAAFSS